MEMRLCAPVTRGYFFLLGTLRLVNVASHAKYRSEKISSGTQGTMEPEICKQMLRNLSEKLAAKFPATTLSYSMVNIACLKDAFSEIFELEASPVEGQLLQLQKEKKRRKRKWAKKIIRKT